MIETDYDSGYPLFSAIYTVANSLFSGDNLYPLFATLPTPVLIGCILAQDSFIGTTVNHKIIVNVYFAVYIHYISFALNCTARL